MSDLYYIEHHPKELYYLLSWIDEEVKLQPIDGGPVRTINGSFVVKLNIHDQSTHCRNGHKFTEENTRMIYDGRTKKKHRRCMKCKRRSDNMYLLRKHRNGQANNRA